MLGVANVVVDRLYRWGPQVFAFFFSLTPSPLSVFISASLTSSLLYAAKQRKKNDLKLDLARDFA